MKQKLIPMAICYDFDGTLSPKNMQEYDFMDNIGVKPDKFWRESNQLAFDQKADQVSAYMRLMLEKSRDKKVPFNKSTLTNYGKQVQLFDGVSDWFEKINAYAKSQGIELKHYIISSGLKEMIEGTSIAPFFHQIYASYFMYDSNDVPYWPAVVLNYTSKTQYLFRINKGCEDINDNKKINKYITPNDRPIPFKNMIYIGDGDTDIPCMRIVKDQGGHAIAVYKKNKPKAKEHAQQLICENRVNCIAPADYRENKLIDTYVKAIIDKVKAENVLSKIK